MSDRTHGELTADGHARWCASCNQEHGPLYLCESYPRWVRNEIEARQAAFRCSLRAQLAAGDRSAPTLIAAAFAGIELQG